MNKHLIEPDFTPGSDNTWVHHIWKPPLVAVLSQRRNGHLDTHCIKISASTWLRGTDLHRQIFRGKTRHVTTALHKINKNTRTACFFAFAMLSYKTNCSYWAKAAFFKRSKKRGDQHTSSKGYGRTAEIQHKMDITIEWSAFSRSFVVTSLMPHLRFVRLMLYAPRANRNGWVAFPLQLVNKRRSASQSPVGFVCVFFTHRLFSFIAV